LNRFAASKRRFERDQKSSDGRRIQGNWGKYKVDVQGNHRGSLNMILNKRHSLEEKLIRKVMVIIRLSADTSIEDGSDVSRYVNSMFPDLPFEEKRDIITAWMRVKNDPQEYIYKELAGEIFEFFSIEK
jgi:hypothetical protein